MIIASLVIGILSSLQGNAQSQQIEVIKFEQLNNLIEERGNDIRVFNFWATWCRPCIKEIPYFEAVNQDFKADGVEVYLISVDFVEDVDTKVKKFAESRGLTAQIKLLDETDYNAFIDKVDPSWSGAIPATLVVNNKTGQRLFYEKEFKDGELESEIRKIID